MASANDDIIGHLLDQAEQMKLDARHAEALVILEEIVVKDPNNIVALEEIADNELSLEHYDRAEVAAKRARALDSGSFDAHYVLGFVASVREQWDASVNSLKIANRLEPNNPEILRCLGWSLFSAGHTVEGVVTLERALNLEDTNPLILCDLGVVYLKMKEFPKARALLERALEIDPLNVRVKECLEMATRISDRGKGNIENIA
ncbi:MAG: tetratricopeptide repeat protein [Devosia sp.]